MTNTEFIKLLKANSEILTNTGYQLNYYNQYIQGTKNGSNINISFDFHWSEYNEIHISQPNYKIRFNEFEDMFDSILSKKSPSVYTIQTGLKSNEKIVLNNENDVIKFMTTLSHFIRSSESSFIKEFDTLNKVLNYCEKLDGKELITFLNHEHNEALLRLLALKGEASKSEFEDYYKGAINDLKAVENQEPWKSISEGLTKIYLNWKKVPNKV